ncbi:hypothetical protein KY285_021525 [Solanum tuberosum]|nr:hypothetical protein KY289_021797 [Solanum tuberosum]KAH0694428.1 hypothetical protein KY285_021525 [Solanum tuberosum]
MKPRTVQQRDWTEREEQRVHGTSSFLRLLPLPEQFEQPFSATAAQSLRPDFVGFS